jgi:hypothetical protein
VLDCAVDETKHISKMYFTCNRGVPVRTVGAVIRVAAKIKVAALLTSILQYLKIKIRFFLFVL